MQIPLSWLNDFVDTSSIPVPLLAERLTVAGLEVSHMTYLGVPQQHTEGVRWPVSDHLVWDRTRLVLGQVVAVNPHPNADRLVVATVNYGGAAPEQAVTGAPNLFPYRDQGTLAAPLYTAFALEGAEVWDGQSDTPRRMVLKGRDLRGIFNKSMVCSEHDLGLSDDHDGVILLHDAPTDRSGAPFAPGTPLQDVFGDVVLEVELTPNLARAFSVLGVAREVAALFGLPLRPPSHEVAATGAPIDGLAAVDIQDAALNPRFTLALLRDTRVGPSPAWMQRRLRLVGQRPINNVVDVTNYLTHEVGQPMHAYDYDKLVARAGGQPATLITRRAQPSESIVTLDGRMRTLPPHAVLVADVAGPLGVGGIMGGADTEVDNATSNVLLEAASWDFINIRQTSQALRLFSEAATRFSRGVAPSQAPLGVRRGIALMQQTGGGTVAAGIVDAYPRPQPQQTVTFRAEAVAQLLGLPTLDAAACTDALQRLGFAVAQDADGTLHATAPDHRMDIDAAVSGLADVAEEIARVIGLDALPNTLIHGAMPPQYVNTVLAAEERVRDLLTTLGLAENISYRLTAPEREALLVPPGAASSWPGVPYVTLANPITSDKTVMRHTLLANLLTNAAANQRWRTRQAVYEIGSVYLPQPDAPLPDEPRRLALLLAGPRALLDDFATPDDGLTMDFFDLKGVVEGLLDGLHVANWRVVRATHTSFHPGRSAALHVAGVPVGVFGELHPLVARAFGLDAAPVQAAEFDLDALLAATTGTRYIATPLPQTPPVLQDVAVIVQADVPAEDVRQVIVRAGGDLLRLARLFDVYTGDPVPPGHKSLAYSLVYQTDERTLTDKEVAAVHKRVVKALERELGAQLRM